MNSILGTSPTNQLQYFHTEDLLMRSNLVWCITSATPSRRAELSFKVEELNPYLILHHESVFHF